MFIAFEGLDGSGSSTHAKLLAEHLKTAGKKVLLTKEPTHDTPIGQLIRKVLQHQWQVSPQALQLLFTADRAAHLSEVIEPALSAGKVVITDRYLFSTLAYGSLDCDLKWLKQLNHPFRLPDITFLLKVPPEECIRRIGQRKSGPEFFEKAEKLKKVWQVYEMLGQEYENVKVIDSTKPKELVAQTIAEIAAQQGA